jgi:uncharacterized protein YfaS (alpha-2-macroglobulin family)
VESFTSGKISRFHPLYLVFNQEVPEEKMAHVDLKNHVKLKPDIAGEFSFENSRTVVFRPSGTFEREREYRVTVDLSGFFEVEKADKLFTFSFSTLPLSIRIDRKSMDMNAVNEGNYDIGYSLYTPDRETAETIESLVRLSEKAETAWQHHADEKNHRLTLKNIPAGEKSRALTVSVAPNKLGLPEETLISTAIPAKGDFTVYDVTFSGEPERFVEVVFTAQLDASQQMEGLASIEGNKDENVSIDGNKLRIYPDANLTGKQTVRLHAAIRSKSGATLKEDREEEVDISGALPDVRFTGEGTIIPLSTDLNIPFQAVYLRGVVVRVIKVLEQNVGQFMQTNSLSGSNDLIRVGRLVARKTIFLDEEGADPSVWKTYAIRLNDLIQPEQGAIYRIELSFNRHLSAYPCDQAGRATKEQLLAEDAVRFREESSQYDNGGYYYYYGDYDWDDYSYRERENPCSNSYYYNRVVGKNILATNLGLMAMSGGNDEIVVLVHNLLSTYPEKGVTVSLYNHQHQVIGSGMTDEKGQAVVRTPHSRPYYLVASLGKQRAYMHVDAGSSLSLSAFDVAGEVVQKGIKGFIYGDRGVWRPGDTLHLGFMLNDRQQRLPAGHPVVMELFNPLGQSYLRKIQTSGSLGVYAFDMPTEADAPTGAWSVQVQVGGVTFSKRLRIESIKPNRLKINLSLPDKPLLRGEALHVPLHVEWLHGAVARHLKYDVQGAFTATPTSFKDYRGFQFDDPAKSFNSEESKWITGKTGETGDATMEVRFDAGPAAPGMLMAHLVTQVYEESGDFSIDGATMLYSPYRRYAGIKSPQADKTQLETDKAHTFDVVSVDYLGKPAANVPLEAEVYKVNWYWWWNADNEALANYVSGSYHAPVRNIKLQTDENGRAAFSLNMAHGDWGAYFIRVKDLEGKHTTGIMSYFDWPDYGSLRNRSGGTSPGMLTFKTDKEQYTAGEKMTVTFPSPQGSRAILCIENGTKILSVSEQLCEAGETTVRIDVTPDMQPNAYIYITLLQPYGNNGNDLPIRLYGVMPFSVTSPESRLHPLIRTTDEFKPDEKYTITVSEKEGREMAYTLAIVDEGLLDLTRFPTPDPWKAFNAREALGVNTWDVYNDVLGAYGGRIEQLFSIGGDDALNKGPKAIVNRFKPVVRFEGAFLLKKGEKRRHTYTMPNYNGRVRLMVVAGNGSAYGHTEKSVVVRKPVMLTSTLPRVIGIGEEMVVPSTVFATEEGVGKVKVSIACSANMEVVGEAAHELFFEGKEDRQALFRIRVKERPGAGQVVVTAEGKGEKSVYTTDIEIRSVERRQVKVFPAILDGGKSWRETIAMPGIGGTNALTLEVSDIPPLNLSSRLSYLLGYPHGCLEQITSKAFPQLYLRDFASLSGEQEGAIEGAVKEVIRRYRSYQMPDGGFAYWPGGSGNNPWGTAYAAHFLLEAAAKGYLVPDGLKRQVLNHIQKAARNWKRASSEYDSQSEEMIQAYRLYVLALAQSPELGAMNRMKEGKAPTVTARWLLASAYAFVGREDVATALIRETKEQKASYTAGDYTYGSDFRDMGIRLQTLCLLKRGEEAAGVATEIANVLSSDRWLSTQETAYALIGISGYMSRYKVSESMDFSFDCAGKREEVKTGKNSWSKKLLDEAGTTTPLEVKNNGGSTLFVRVITEGVPAQGEEEAYENGVSMEVKYVDGDNRTIDVSSLPQGVHFSAVVTVKNPTPNMMRNLVVTELFPSGWEILNTRFMNGQPAQPNGVSYQDIRDDRVCTYIDNLHAGHQVTFRINLTTAYAGKFHLPAAYCEAMYDRLIRANTKGQEVIVNSEQ